MPTLDRPNISAALTPALRRVRADERELAAARLQLLYTIQPSSLRPLQGLAADLPVPGTAALLFT